MHISSLFDNIDIKQIAKSIKPRTLKDVQDLIFEELKKCHKVDEDNERELAYRQNRKPKLYRKPSYVAMVIKLKGCKSVADLEYIHGRCKEAKHYAKCFYGMLK